MEKCIVDISKLVTIKNYATKQGVTASYIYKLAKEGKMKVVTIDGVQFVDVKQHPVIPTR